MSKLVRGYRLRVVFCFLAGFLISSASYGQEGSIDNKVYPDFTYEDLQALIKTKRITSVDQLTHALPEELQTNITFRLRPHNRLQEGVRAIRFTSDGRLILTHSSSATDKGGNNLEIIEKTTDNRTVMHEVSFSPNGKNPPVFSEKQGPHGSSNAKCATCHGEPLRRIFESYNTWPDTCGAEDDIANEECLKFLQEAKTNSRFKDLKWDSQNKAWPYMQANMENSDLRGLRLMPNTRLTYITQIENAKTMALKVEQSELWPKLKYSLLAQNLCELGPDLQSRLEAALAKSTEYPLPPRWRGTRAEYIATITNYIPSPKKTGEGRNVPSRRDNFYELFGIELGDTGSGEMRERNAATAISIDPAAINDSSQSYLLAQLLNDLNSKDPILATTLAKAAYSYPATTSPGQDQGNSRYGNDFFAADTKFKKEFEGIIYAKRGLKEACPHLLDEAKKEITELEKRVSQNGCAESAKASAKNLQNLANLGAPLNKLVVEKGKQILGDAKCIACHDPSAGSPVGPRIKFSDPASFRTANADHAMMDGSNLIDSAKILISDETDPKRRMPLNNPPLSAEEQAAVIAYLNSLAGGVLPATGNIGSPVGHR